MLVMAAASGIMTAAGGYAHADASADGAAIGSPGVGSGNAIQAPVNIPVNLCGNTVDVVGLLNPAFGNHCKNDGGDAHRGNGQGAGAEAGDAHRGDAHRDNGHGASAEGVAAHSPGVLSGNLIQAPIDIPVNACGNTVDVVGALNPAFGNHCSNGSAHHHRPPTHHKPPVYHQPPAHHHHDCPPAHHHKPPVHHKPPTHHKPPVYHQPPAHHVNWPHHNWNHHWHHQNWNHNKPPQMAHTGTEANVGIAGAAGAAMVLGGTFLMRRARAAQK
ncbi:chaplin [Streptomyces sp. NPDC058231]|uniref:chaplin n=1 Tax=Streptomyces sp. NPDC058231 TaxID=3346392 RepID=UPI0036ED71D4